MSLKCIAYWNNSSRSLVNILHCLQEEEPVLLWRYSYSCCCD